MSEMYDLDEMVDLLPPEEVPTRLCNFCDYQGIRRRAKPWQRVEILSDGQTVEVDGKFVAWFMGLPDSCCC